MLKCGLVTFNTRPLKFHTKPGITNTAITMLIRRRTGEKCITTLHLHARTKRKWGGGAFTPPAKLSPEFMAQVTYAYTCFAAVHENPVINNNLNIQDIVQKQHTKIIQVYICQINYFHVMKTSPLLPFFLNLQFSQVSSGWT